MAQGDYFTPALPTNQSPFGEVVFQCCGLPTILDQQQGAWKTLGDQRAFIELVSPPNIILKHKDGRFLGEIKLTASMQYHQSSPDSFIIQTNQRVYGLRLSNSKDATTFMNTLIELHQILKSLPVQSNVSTHHSYKYQPLNHQYNDSHQNIQYGIPQNNSPPILSPVHQFQAVATQHQSVLAKQLPLASQQVQHQQYMSQQQHLRLQQQQQQLQLQQQLQQQHLRSQQQQQHLLMMQTQQQQQQQQHPSMSQKQPILHEDFTNMPIQPQNLFPSVSKGPKSPNHQSLLGVMHQNFFVDGSDDKAEPSKPPPMSEEELACDVLSESIEKGNVEKAKEMSSKLAEKNCKLTVQLLDGESIEKHKNFQIIVYVEDKVEPRGAPIFLHVDPQITTIRMLKYKVSKDYGFPVLIQRWIINDRLLKDNDSLVKCGVRNSSTAIYLYLISMEDEKQKDVEIQTEPLISPHTRQNAYDVNLSGNIFRMQSPYGGNTGMWFNGEQDLLQQQMQSGLRPQIPQIPSHNLQMQDIYSPPSFAQLPPLKVVRPRDTPVRKEGWECPGCTYKNPPTFPGCRMCSTERPEDYNAPENYQLDPEEEERLRTEEYLERLTIEAEFKRKAEEAKVAHRNFLQTMEHAKMKIIPNPDAFDCPICFTNFGVGEAVMLRECLHCFCRDCLTETIKASEDPEVRCPHNDGFPCPAVITGQEIEELLPEEEFNKFLDRSLAAAEHRTDNSFHCRSPNCIGWCIYEDEVNIFLCPACKQQNCLTCKAIHVNKTCKQYQDELKVRAENDEAAKKTQHMLQELIARGDAMNCPKCKVILQKKSGCDWMRCTMCRTEICWATKGPRWGPNGPGDTSGGCKCNIGGKKCTPQCGNCH